MKKFLVWFIAMILLSYGAQSQASKTANPSYKSAIGLRYLPFGISLKTNNPGGTNTFEIIGYFKDGFTASALKYWNYAVNQPHNLKLYIGGGMQAGYKNVEHGGGAVLGVGGVLGVDYKFVHLPLNISLDWQPSLQFGRTSDYNGLGGIAARFTL